MKAVIYARYSSDAQREESIDGQIRECTEFAQRKNYTILSHYIDRALSAKTADRPEFQRMVKDSAKGQFDTVIVWKLDRFSRDRYDSAFYKHVLKKNGVKVISATENISEGPEGIILEAMLEGMAEYYSAELKVKVERGHKENALKLKHNGGTTPYGFFIDKPTHTLQIQPEQAAIVREMFTRFDRGERIVDIVRDLNDRGIVCSYGKPFTKGRINAILQSRRYIGEYKYDDTVVPGGIPAIIDQELFDRVSKKLNQRRIGRSSEKSTEKYILTTKLFCGYCGHRMIGERGTGHYNKSSYLYYKCGGAKVGKCERSEGIRKAWIEKLAVLITMDVVFKDKVIDRIADSILKMHNAEDPKLPAMRQQLADCEKRISNMLNAMEEGVVTSATKTRLEELEKKRDTLSVSISQLEIEKPKLSKYEIVSWINHFRFSNINDAEFQSEVIDTFLNSIFVFKDRLVFIFNYQEGTKTLKLNEVKSAFCTYLKVTPPTRFNPKFVFLNNAFGFVISKKSANELHGKDLLGTMKKKKS